MTSCQAGCDCLEIWQIVSNDKADHMGITPDTVKQYLSTTLQKWNIRQRKDLKKVHAALRTMPAGDPAGIVFYVERVAAV